MSYSRPSEIHALLREDSSFSRRDIEERIQKGHAELKEFDELLMRRGQVAGQLADMKSLLAPIRLLPRDILYQIFLLCCISWEDQVQQQTLEELQPLPWINIPNRFVPPPFDDFSGPWPLSQVCVKWREIILSHPHLWTRFYVDPGHHNRIHGRPVNTHLALLARLHLERSGNLPNLDIILRGRVTHSDLIDTLAATSHRWHRLMCSEDTVRLFSTLPSLHTLFPLSKSIQTSRERPPFQAPLLREIYLLGSTTWREFPLPDFNQGQITRLTCRDKNLSFEMVEEMTALREIHVFFVEEEVSLDDRELNFPLVEKVIFTELFPTRQMDDILTHMRLPGLTDLTLNVSRDASDILLPTLFQADQLRSLTMDLGAFQADAEADELFQFLARVPNIEHLDISVSIVTPFLILEGLSMVGNQPTLLPHLASLAIQISADDFADGVPLRFVGILQDPMYVSVDLHDPAARHRQQIAALFNIIESRVHFGSLRRLDISCQVHDSFKQQFASQYTSLFDVLLLV